MASLRNGQIDMEIGITPIGAFKQPALYIKEGNQKRVIAQFFSKDKAEMFMEALKRWDEAGGNDNDDSSK
jgi:hypothetical protein